ncbi:uncharacterized protein A4U43_C05F20490 [Asparagus officinalis]|uniref:Methyltransferase small domain-containing protein n=1 Tax=Asparagus officinalis TaxID=4686 RepID=A0A5P1EYH3_ASPOF|nr:uncharacterized protein A4U43_C05F20490 [Asparagus officinalis]
MRAVTRVTISGAIQPSPRKEMTSSTPLRASSKSEHRLTGGEASGWEPNPTRPKCEPGPGPRPWMRYRRILNTTKTRVQVPIIKIPFFNLIDRSSRKGAKKREGKARRPIMKLKQLEGLLGDLEQFPTPKVDIDLIQCDIKDIEWRGLFVDTIVMNPPFGTRKKGSDMEFLSMALKVASQAVYSLHKTTTRDHIKRAALRSFGASSAEVLCELRYDVPQMYKFHRKKEVDIAVDLWRFVPGPAKKS